MSCAGRNRCDPATSCGSSCGRRNHAQQGLIKVGMTVLNQNGETVQVLVANLMVPRRSGNMPRESSAQAG
jgi:hypothetical protein